MTLAEQNLLDELKDFFEKKYTDKWEENFKKYTKKLVSDGHIEQSIIDEFLDDEVPNEIVKRFKSFSKEQKTRSVDPCSSTSYSSGCGSSPSPSRSTYSSGCGSSSSSRSSC